MTTSFRSPPVKRSGTTSGNTNTNLAGAVGAEVFVADGESAVVRVSVECKAQKTVDTVVIVEHFGEVFEFTAARSGVTVTLTGTLTVTLATGITLTVTENSDDGDATGFFLTLDDDRSALLSLSTSTVAIIEKVLATIG
jgi:hypothetical protein